MDMYVGLEKKEYQEIRVPVGRISASSKPGKSEIQKNSEIFV